MKASTKQTYPENIVVFDVETRPATCDTTGVCLACRRIENGEITAEDEVQQLILGSAISWDGQVFTFVKADQFWDWVTALGSIWLVNHNIGYDLMAMGWDDAMTSRGWTADKIIIPEPNGPFAITWVKENHFIKMVNLANWWGTRPLSSIGEIVGESKIDLDPTKFRHVIPETDDWRTLETYCIQDCRVVQKAITMWIDFCKDHDLGQFALTQAGQSLSAFQHRLMRHNIYIHTNKRALKLERESYMGARTECFALGEYHGQFHTYDVNSLYPYVMKENDYPNRLRGIVKNVTIEEYWQIRQDYCCVATALIGINAGNEHGRVVPLRHDGKLIYPTGSFYTTLTSGELDLAIRRGIVRDLPVVCIYDRARLFEDYVDEFYRLRLSYKKRGNLIWYEIVKVFLNSLYGKFGQFNYDWLPSQDPINIKPGSVTKIIDADTHTSTTYRHVGGTLAKRSSEREEGWNSFAAIAAHVTAYARLWISHLREQAGTENVYYCDTDSLFVNHEGHTRLKPWIDPNKLGYLKLEKSADFMIIRGLKDYQFGDKIKTKGIRSDAIKIGDNQYRQTQFRGVAGSLRTGDTNVARITQVTKTMKRIYTKGTISEGKVVPHHLELVPW